MHITVRPKDKLVGRNLKLFYRSFFFELPANWRERPKFTLSETEFAKGYGVFVKAMTNRRPRCTSDSQ